MPLEEIESPAMHGHRRRIGERNAFLGHHLENAMLARRTARVRLECERDERTPVGFAIGTNGFTRRADLRSDANHEREIVALQELDCSTHGAARRTATHST